jgi:tripeptidyl-peptidase-1
MLRMNLNYVFLLCILSFVFISITANVFPTHIFKEKSKVHLREDIHYLRRAPSSESHEIIFAIKHKNIEELTQVLYDVSDPESENYGKHWSRQQVIEYISNPEGYEALISFLRRENIEVTTESLYKEYISARAPVEKWEKLLSCQFHVYKLQSFISKNSNTKESIQQSESVLIIRTAEYSLPMELAEHISAAFNTVQFPHPRIGGTVETGDKTSTTKEDRKKMLREVATVSTAQESAVVEEPLALSSKSIDWNQPGFKKGAVTPAFLALYYNVPNTTASPIVSQAVFESLSDRTDPDDLTKFQKEYNLLIQPIARSVGDETNHIVVGACIEADGAFCGESNLDVQYLMGMAQNVPTTYYYAKDIPKGQIDWVDFLLKIANSPQLDTVYSISYGSYEITLSLSEAEIFNIIAIELGVMGTTIFASSGDDGVVGHETRKGIKNCGYFPQFPASSPYVTAVGGTNGPQYEHPEIACMSGLFANAPSITTGGGFSDVYNAPSYQIAYQREWVKKVNNTIQEPYYNSSTLRLFGVDMIPGVYNSSMRGYPDISFIAHSYQVFINGEIQGIDGTSASCPVFAALVNLVNYRRKLAGNSTMGWLNPFLYKKSSSFVKDITVGHNNCTAVIKINDNRFINCCKHGFSATPGWDPVTGLGSLNWNKFLFAATGIVMEDAVQPASSPKTTTSVTSTDVTESFYFLGAYIGIAIGGFMFILFVGGAAYCCLSRTCIDRGSKSVARVSPGDAEN